MRIAAAGLLAAVIAAGCADDSESTRQRTDAVLYTIGLSTDPYGESSPGGFGVATGMEHGKLAKVEVRQPGLGGFGGAGWLDGGTIVVGRSGPPLRRHLVFRYDGGLKRQGEAPVPGGAVWAWSRGTGLFAYEPPIPCSPRQRSLYRCYRWSGELLVVGRDGSSRRSVTRGHLMGWTADGRIAFFRSYQRATPYAYDLRAKTTGALLPGWKIGLPAWSSDRRYVAAIGERGVVVARNDGSTVQRIPSKLMISMLAWSPAGNRLAFTTSGFPDPHQLFVVDHPAAKPRLLYATGDMHFDWITWSPDGKFILLDEEHHARWLLLRSDLSGERRTLPRLGGRPLWCCPVNAFRGS